MKRIFSARRSWPGTLAVVGLLLALQAMASDRGPIEGWVQTPDVRLEYLDWGGTGPPLILIHGLGDNPHVFDDLAPAFVDHFHVLAYARRGSGSSEVKGPYDVGTMTRDLQGFMDALGISRAILVGYSAGAGEVTEFASRFPDRVERVIYFEGGYDGADPVARALIHAMPSSFFAPPVQAMRSWSAFLEFEKATEYARVDDIARIEGNLRAKVVIQPDGSLKYRTTPDVVSALYGALMSDKRRDYRGVKCPVLALYADTLYELQINDAGRRARLTAFERQYWKPFQLESIAQLERELPNVRIVHVHGTHDTFFLTDRAAVVRAMRSFLLGPSQPALP
jgi:pimeloyl-ACP methyl ester carboxylesterase